VRFFLNIRFKDTFILHNEFKSCAFTYGLTDKMYQLVGYQRPCQYLSW